MERNIAYGLSLCTKVSTANIRILSNHFFETFSRVGQDQVTRTFVLKIPEIGTLELWEVCVCVMCAFIFLALLHNDVPVLSLIPAPSTYSRFSFVTDFFLTISCSTGMQLWVPVPGRWHWKQQLWERGLPQTAHFPTNTLHNSLGKKPWGEKVQLFGMLWFGGSNTSPGSTKIQSSCLIYLVDFYGHCGGKAP